MRAKRAGLWWTCTLEEGGNCLLLMLNGDALGTREIVCIAITRNADDRFVHHDGFGNLMLDVDRSTAEQMHALSRWTDRDEEFRRKIVPRTLRET